jgi:hypothetical protein
MEAFVEWVDFGLTPTSSEFKNYIRVVDIDKPRYPDDTSLNRAPPHPGVADTE